MNVWYNAFISYDGSTAKLYLNGVLACSQGFSLVQGGDKDIGVTNFSNGGVFTGVFNHLKVWNQVRTP